MDELKELQEKIHKIKTWINAYPLSVFPEPDFQKAHKVLKQHGMTLDAISASNMRHVLEGIKNIIETDNQPLEPTGEGQCITGKPKQGKGTAP